MSFNLDDPLAGILSDNSDDSFFDDDILGKKKPNKKDTSALEKKKTLFDLGQNKPNVVSDANPKIDSLLSYDEKNKTTAAESQVSSAIGKSITSSPFKQVPYKESNKMVLDSKNKELFGEIDIGKSPAKTKMHSDQAKPTDKGKSSQSLLDDILGTSSTKSGVSIKMQKTTSTTKSQEFGLDLILGKTDSKQVSSLNKNVSLKPIVVEDKIKKDNSVKKTKTNEDWLGIFEEKDDIDAVTDMPTWLTSKDNVKYTNKRNSSKDEQKTTSEIVNEEEAKGITENDKEKEKDPFESNLNQLMKPIQSSNILGSSNEDITAEGAVLFLQQQESQLAVALQLKAQEEKLAALQLRQKESQRVQREAEEAQHVQIEAMLRRQAEHRRQMQSIIAGHQERITKRIKDLLVGTSIPDDSNKDVAEDVENSVVDKRESPHGKEKRQLLQLVQSLQENHDKEIDLMETSYRRQLAFLEVSSNQAEERMKEESDKIVKFYTEKIHWLEEHHQLYKKLTEENLNSLTERHKAESETFKQQHLENMKILQEHHAVLMENIKNAVKQEQNLVKDSSSFSSSLTGIVVDVKESRSQCKELLEKIDLLTETVKCNVEKSLKTRETQVNEMIQQLQRDRENFEKEKTESKDIVKMLETRLRQMTTMIEEEAASLKQKKMEFEFEKATFSKQSEFAKNVLKKQDEEMKVLKEDFIKEYQDKIAKIDEEKTKTLKDSAAVATEKASMQSLKQELEKMKVELQAQFQELSEERSKLNLEKQQMHMEKQRILAKNQDLEMLSKSAIEKQSEAQNKYSEAEHLQRKYEERIQRIQEHVVSLNAREKQIAREKVVLSRERLNLHNERKRFENSQQCSLCRSTQNIPYIEPIYTFPETIMDTSVSRDNGENFNTAATVIEQEMIRLMGSNFNHRTVAENENLQDRTFHSRDVMNHVPIKDIQIETEPFKDYMDPKFMMMRLDVKQVISNLDQNKKTEIDKVEKETVE